MKSAPITIPTDKPISRGFRISVNIIILGYIGLMILGVCLENNNELNTMMYTILYVIIAAIFIKHNDNNVIKYNKKIEDKKQSYMAELNAWRHEVEQQKKKEQDELDEQLIAQYMHDEAIRKKNIEDEINRQREIQNQRLQLIKASGIPSSMQELDIQDSDYQRNNETDRKYRKKFTLHILKVYDNQCAICGATDNGVDIDHFYVPKSKGGNFVLRRHDGVLVNNAVPMCETCNRSKIDKDWKKLYPYHVTERIHKINADINLLLNAA